MTNFQPIKKSGITREAVLFAVPLSIGLLIAAISAASLAWPVWQRLGTDLQALQSLREQRDRIPLLRQQLVKLKRDFQRQKDKQDLVVRLIAGSGDISTFMTQLALEAVRSGVQLDGYEPLVEPSGSCDTTKQPQSAKPSGKSTEPPPPPPDPVLCAAPELEKVTLLLTARGNGPSLQQFLRGLEKLSLLVVQKDLSFKYEPTQTVAAPPQRHSPAGPPPVVMRLSLSLYREAANPPSGSPHQSAKPSTTSPAQPHDS